MRPQMTRILSVVATAIAIAAMLAGCGRIGGSVSVIEVSTGSPIVVGTSLPLTGAFAADGQAFERGYRLWMNDVNSQGGLLGRSVKLIILNDASSPAKVVSDYQTLIKVDHVNLTFGPFSSLLTIPAAETVAPLGYAMIEGAGTANSVFDDKSNKKYHNIFSPSLPVADYMLAFVQWIGSLPVGQRPRTAAYPSAADPFAAPPVHIAQVGLQRAGIRTVYSNIAIPEKVSAYKAPAVAVAASGAQLVVLGSTDVPTVSAFMHVFELRHYSPKVFIAVSGPDQGQAFLGTVGQANANGVMVPGGWNGAYANALSYQMVEEYIANYGGTAASINADVAEAFSVGEVAADAVQATHGTDNAKIIKYLHSGVTLQSVQGPVQFTALGENPKSVAFIFQWQNGSFNKVLPAGDQGSVKLLYPKPVWGG